MDWIKIYSNMDSRSMFKTISFVCGLIGLILTWTEVKSYSMFQEQLSSAYDLDLEFVKNVWVKNIYKTSMIFVILTRKYTWYPYIIAYFFMLFAIVFDLKRIIALWLFISGIRSLFVNIFVVFTGLWFGCISCSNKLTMLDFVLFKIIQLGLSAWFWHRILLLYRSTTAIDKNLSSRLSRKRRASFHGFGWNERRSRSSLFRSALDEDSESEFLTGPSHQSDFEFLNAVRRSPSVDDLVNRKIIDWFVDEANSMDEREDKSSSYSIDLAARAQKFLQLTPEELARASKMKLTETMMEKRISSINQLLKLQPLPVIDFWDEKSEIELNAVDMSEAIKKASQKIRDQMPFTPESFLGIFYKHQNFTYKPTSNVVEESEDESSEEVIDAKESNEHENVN